MASLRNIGIIAHIDAGKTTFTERVLFYSGVISRMGEVHEGAATTDFLPEEQERGITIEASCVHFSWAGCEINLIDTPGHIDFSMEVERSLRVLDAAVGVFCGVSGVEPQAEQVWRQSGRFAFPRLAVINKMDREGASYNRVLAELSATLDLVPLPVTIPLGEGDSFCGVIDLVSRRVLEFPAESTGRNIVYRPLSPEEEAMAAPHLETLCNRVTEEDDALLEQWLSGLPLRPEAVGRAIRKGALARRFTPVYAVSALKNIGIQPVLDGIAQFLPSPQEGSPVVAQRLLARKEPETGQALTEELLLSPDSEAPFCGFVFKTVRDKKGDVTAFVRIYSGAVQAGKVLHVHSRLRGAENEGPRVFTVSGIMHIIANDREGRSSAKAGEIVALAGCEGLVTGDTLCAEGVAAWLDPVEVQPPVLSLAFEAGDGTELAALDAALAAIAEDDLSVRVSRQGGQRLVSGMGELQLEIVHTRLKREFGLCPRVGNPQVVCFEQPSGRAEGTGEFTRLLGSSEHYGFVRLSISPDTEGAENWRGLLHQSGVYGSHEEFLRLEFSPDLSPRLAHFQEAVREGIMASAGCGPRGAPLVLATVRVLSMGEYSGRETEAGFRTAGQIAFFRALAEGGTVLLEPIMNITATAPEASFGAVLNLLASCGAEVQGRADAEGKKLVHAEAPVRELFGFASRLRSATRGRAGMTMSFSRYAKK